MCAKGRVGRTGAVLSQSLTLADLRCQADGHTELDLLTHLLLQSQLSPRHHSFVLSSRPLTRSLLLLQPD